MSDQACWQQALRPAVLFGGRGLASGWANPTRQSVERGYGAWVDFLQRNHALDPCATPAARATPSMVAAYHLELATRIAPVSVASALRNLGEALRVMDPGGDRTAVLAALRHAQANACPSRDYRRLMVGASVLYDAGLRRMERVLRDGCTTREAAARYGDGLAIAILAGKAVRRRNAVATVIGTNLLRSNDGAFSLHYAPDETKTKAAISAVLPASLSPYIDRWLAEVRPLLLRGRESDVLWIEPDGRDIRSSTFYERFCRATLEELGVRINPHAVRKIVATSISVSAPELVEITARLLDHTSDEMRKEHYDLATKLAMSKQYITLLEVRRREALNHIETRSPLACSR